MGLMGAVEVLEAGLPAFLLWLGFDLVEFLEDELAVGLLALLDLPLLVPMVDEYGAEDGDDDAGEQ